jgi:hypothetical protein
MYARFLTVCNTNLIVWYALVGSLEVRLLTRVQLIEAIPPWTPLGCTMIFHLPMSRETTPLMVASVIESDH